MKTKGSALKRALGALLKAGLVAEQRAGRDDEAWRTDEADRRLALAITPAGLSAIGLGGADAHVTTPDTTGAKHLAARSAKVRRPSCELESAGKRHGKPKGSGERSKPRPSRQNKDGSPDESRRQGKASDSTRPGTKAAAIIEMLRKPGGASVERLTEATGWQAHSVRGFLSGTLKKKLGHTVISERQEGVRRYRIPA